MKDRQDAKAKTGGIGANLDHLKGRLGRRSSWRSKGSIVIETLCDEVQEEWFRGYHNALHIASETLLFKARDPLAWQYDRCNVAAGLEMVASECSRQRGSESRIRRASFLSATSLCVVSLMNGAVNTL
jgi:hypothetical protein